MDSYSVGYAGAVPPGESPRVLPTMPTRPHTEKMTTKPITPQRMNSLPVVRSVSLVAPRIKYLYTPHMNVKKAIASNTGTRMPLMMLIMLLAYPCRYVVLMPPEPGGCEADCAMPPELPEGEG